MTLEQEIALLKEQIILKDEQLKRKDERILELERQVYGRRSEKRLPKYMDTYPSLFDGELGQESFADEQVTSIIEEIQSKAEVRRAFKKQARPQEKRTYRIPDNIERRQTILLPQGVDLSNMIQIGEDVTERLQLEPARFWVERIVRPIYKEKSLVNALHTTLYQAALPESILPGCIAGNSLLAAIAVDKFLNHLPEHRQVARFKSYGMELSTSSVNRWIHALANELYALYTVQMQQILSSDYIQVDETILPVNDRPKVTRKGYVWAVRSVESPAVFFYYHQGSRSQEVILKLLKDYRGALQTDGYAAYSIYEDKKGVLPLGCMAHVRRKFEHALESDPQAKVGLDYIGLLYTLEANLQFEQADPKEIRKQREEKAWPILQQMEEWMAAAWKSCTPKSPLGKAISYAFGMWPRVSRYCKEGRFRIDNNDIERAIRPWAVGRKNYLFSDNDKCAEDHCVFYTLIGSSMQVGVDPLRWMNQALSMIRPEMKADDLKKLLPAVLSEK